MKKLLRLFFFVLLTFFLYSIWQVIIYRFVPPLYTLHMVGSFFQEDQLKYDWVPMDKISPWAGIAVIAAEDQKFIDHNGFDLEALQKVIEERQQGIKKRGGSTISQQVSKNLFLWHGKNYFRKGLEAYYTVLIETFWPKERILEMYLNVAQLGPGIYGVGAASGEYFNKMPQELTIDEAAMMAAVLPNPVRFSLAKPSGYVIRRKNWIVDQSYQLGGKNLIGNL